MRAHAGRRRRLRQRQSCLGRARACARGGTAGPGRRYTHHRGPRAGRAGGSDRPSRPGRVRRLRRRPCRRFGAEGGDAPPRGRGRAVSGHLRRHAADGRARPGIRRDRGSRMGARRDCPPAGGQPAPARIWAGTSWCSSRSRTRFWPGCKPGDHAYFVHSYALQASRPEQVLATTDYDGPVVAMVAAGNRAGTQFHVEKSQRVGLQILGNFLRWSP